MEIIKNGIFDEERALYGKKGVECISCRFDGPADGESAFKEASDIVARDCFFNLRYPFWHCDGVRLEGCEMTELCRAAVWYASNVEISSSRLHGIKALRECKGVSIANSDIASVEFGWLSENIRIKNTAARGEYFMLMAKDITLESFSLLGKYSFQYIKNAVIESCILDTKDAFWHAKGVTVRNCTVKGEYLAWYSEDITFENCIISGTQPFCYCKGLRLINCEMHDTDLAFERSDVKASITTPVISIKEPYSGSITLPGVGEVIGDTHNCVITVGNETPGEGK